jgi:lysozyme family protein
MSYTPSEIIARVIEREGGSKITNDPSDPGGLTKYGISARSNPDLEIEKLTLNDAVSIYHKRYWKPSKVEHLKFSLQEMYFDMVVNVGKKRAVKILQEAINHKGKTIKIDGLIGKNTIGASSVLELNRLKAFRIKYYSTLVERKPSLLKYYYGWFRRAEEID